MTSGRGWYEDFFSGLVLDMWAAAVDPTQTQIEVDFLERSLGLRKGARVLDVPCGLGRHALAMASRGYRITGVDLSEEAIERARAASQGLDVTWKRADMRDLPQGEKFDAAYCLGNSYGYLEPEGTRAFLRAVAGVLAPGARFAMDYGMAAECILRHFREREWAQVGDILFLEENRYDVHRSLVETTYTFIRGAEQVTRKGVQWVHTVRDVLQSLAEAGFETKEVLGSADGTPFAVGGAGCLIVVAEKR